MSHPRDLRSLSLFHGCSADELALAGRLLTPIDASTGRVLMAQGEGPQQFVVVEEGEGEVVHHHEGTPDLTIVLGPDSYVGEIGLLDGVPCTATVRTVGPARVHVAGARSSAA